MAVGVLRFHRMRNAVAMEMSYLTRKGKKCGIICYAQYVNTPKCLPVDLWINKFIFSKTYKMQYYLVTWMKLEDVIINEIIHRKALHAISNMWDLKRQSHIKQNRV